ncbi:hypothetical protein ACFQER_03120 [Halomicroarcula sp. GCM10025894]|uniref:hypothetical protein n=1 Tax=Halomicroarcula sp. GCM10025894 TaxID=3252673 RepID=UPI00361F31BF
MEGDNDLNNRGAISKYLNELKEKGIVDVERTEQQNKADHWYVTAQYHPQPERITETEIQTVRYESFGEWFDDYDTLVYVFLMGTIVGSLSVGYEILRFSLGVWPELILFLSLPALFGVLLPGIKEVYF